VHAGPTLWICPAIAFVEEFLQPQTQQHASAQEALVQEASSRMHASLQQYGNRNLKARITERQSA
jgi:hypothetical protein